MTDYYKVIFLWATWVYSYLISGSYAYWSKDSICIYFSIKTILYAIFLVTYQNFFCIQGKHRFTRRRSSYVTIWFMEEQKRWIWEKREKIPLGTHRVTYIFYYYSSHFLMFGWTPSPLGIPQGKTFMKHFLPTALHPHSQEATADRTAFT